MVVVLFQNVYDAAAHALEGRHVLLIAAVGGDGEDMVVFVAALVLNVDQPVVADPAVALDIAFRSRSDPCAFSAAHLGNVDVQPSVPGREPGIALSVGRELEACLFRKAEKVLHGDQRRLLRCACRGTDRQSRRERDEQRNFHSESFLSVSPDGI